MWIRCGRFEMVYKVKDNNTGNLNPLRSSPALSEFSL